jgi:hypothetical protein
VLRSNARANVRVFVVWEPVLTMDWGTPSQALTSYVPDPRAVHFWDRDRRLSAMYGGAARLPALADTEQVGFRMKDVVWDTALVYAPGQPWGGKAKLLVAPVMKYRAELSGAL